MNLNAVFNFLGFKANRVNATVDTSEVAVAAEVPTVAVKAKRGRKPGTAAPKAPKVAKVKPYEKLVQVMRTGEPVSPEQFADAFKDDAKMSKNLYRLSAYMWEIRKNGGVVKVAKDGKKVVSYQLLNYAEFDDAGKFVVPQQIVVQEVNFSEVKTTEQQDQPATV